MWVINYHGQHKVLKNFPCWFSIEPSEYEKNDAHLFVSDTLEEAIVMTHMAQNMGLQINIKTFVVNPEFNVGPTT